MSAPPAQVIVAELPTRPTVRTAAATPPTMVVGLPGAPVSRVDGTQVPVIPAFVYAGFSGAAAAAVKFTPSASAAAAASGLGTFTAPTKPTQPVTLSLSNEASATGRVIVGPLGKVVVDARFGTEAVARTANAVSTATGSLTATVTSNPGARA